jgi:hypothetical protein
MQQTGSASLLERDFVLTELREIYAELRFTDPKPVTPTIEEPKSVAESEPAVVVTEEPLPNLQEEVVEQAEEPKEEPKGEEVVEEKVATPVVEEVVAPAVEETPIEEAPAKTDTNNDVQSTLEEFRPRRSVISSLYDESAKKEVLGESFHEQPSIADTIACPKGVAEMTRISSLRKAIGVADRFMLVRELFGGDEESYNYAIDSLDDIASFDDCVVYIAENFEWQAQNEGTKLMMELLQRKFNA